MTRTPEEVVEHVYNDWILQSFSTTLITEFGVACVKADREQREAVTDAEVEAGASVISDLIDSDNPDLCREWATKVLAAARNVRT